MRGQDWERESCKEHIWLKGRIGGLDTLLGFVHFKRGSNSREENTLHLACIMRDIRQIGRNREVIIMGDMNARLEDSDGANDATGRMLLEFCESMHLVMTNTQVKCEAKIT